MTGVLTPDLLHLQPNSLPYINPFPPTYESYQRSSVYVVSINLSKIPGTDAELLSSLYRCTSGRLARPCLPVRKVSNQCRALRSAPRTTTTYLLPTRVYHASTFLSTHPRSCCAASSYWPLRQRPSDSFDEAELRNILCEMMQQLFACIRGIFKVLFKIAFNSA